VDNCVDSSGPSIFVIPNHPITKTFQELVNFYGHIIKAQNAFYLPTGNGKVSFVDVRDIAAVAVQALTKNGSRHVNKVYEITGQEALSCYQAAEILSNAIGKKIDYVNISDEDARGAMKEVGLNDWLINHQSDLYMHAGTLESPFISGII
jgi:uncharacterized protein YbjT (DUF2867 family)